MPGRLIVVCGTDTGIGKTHLASLLLRRARALGVSAVGYKPVESGVDGVSISDANRLAESSDPRWLFHVKHAPTLKLTEAISPHLAAEHENTSLPWAAIRKWIALTRQQTNVLVELPGGLFTPLSRSLLNVDAARELEPDVVVLATSDCLGVLNRTLAAITAARARALQLHAIALMGCSSPDASSKTNAAELECFMDVPLFGPWGWGADADDLPATVELTGLWLSQS